MKLPERTRNEILGSGIIIGSVAVGFGVGLLANELTNGEEMDAIDRINTELAPLEEANTKAEEDLEAATEASKTLTEVHQRNGMPLSLEARTDTADLIDQLQMTVTYTEQRVDALEAQKPHIIIGMSEYTVGTAVLAFVGITQGLKAWNKRRAAKRTSSTALPAETPTEQ